MSSVEFEGKNVDKTVKIACDELNIAAEDLDYEVLSRGSSGIFGLAGAKKARIRVNLPEPAPEPVPDDNPDISDGTAFESQSPAEGPVAVEDAFSESG